MQRNEFQPESPLKALISPQVLLAAMAMVVYCFTIVVPDLALVEGNEPAKSEISGIDVLKEARKLRPWKLMEKSNLVGAVGAAQLMLASNPNDVVCAYCAAMVFKKSNNVADAYAQMRRALSLAPRDNDLRLEYARLLADTNKLDDAIVQYRLVIKHSPKLTGPRMDLAQLFLNTDKPAECARELEDLLKVAPDDIVAHKIRGIALARSGKAQEGMDEYLAGMQSEHSAGQSEGVKFILEAWGNMDKAKYELEQQAARSPDDPMPKLRLAEISLYADHPAEAKTYLLDARKLAPTNVEVQRSLCVAYKRLGDNKLALTSFMQSVALEKEQTNKNQKAPAK